MIDITETTLPGVLLLESRIHRDERGWFTELWNPDVITHPGLQVKFVQNNASASARGVLRGMHFQNPQPQGKLVSVLHGEVFDVAVDIRAGSPTFAKWFGCSLSETNGRRLYIPEGFAHGFLVMSHQAVVQYSCTATYHAPGDRGFAWDDPDVAIEWPVPPTMVSPKDSRAPRLKQLSPDSLPRFS